jgi:heme/copper-type cytochrome/quinol oxidase subunit 3
MSTQAPEVLSPTTGESMATVGRRNTLALWLLIVADAAGTIALLISYTYLWSLNVNGGWAPPGAKLTAVETNNDIPKHMQGSFAPEWPFWAILGIVILSTAAMWWAYRSGKAGFQTALVTGSVLSLLLMLAALIGQWVQISTFPFGPSDGAYASAVIVLCASNIFHMLIVIFLLTGMVNRSRRGLINQQNHYQAQATTYYMTWVSISVLLGALVTTFFVVSPNTDPAVFGSFKQVSSSSAEVSPAPSSSPSATPSASPSDKASGKASDKAASPSPSAS